VPPAQRPVDLGGQLCPIRLSGHGLLPSFFQTHLVVKLLDE
jgi:hypothetical protein